MKKTLTAVAVLALLAGGVVAEADDPMKKAPTAEEKARETCTKKGLTGSWLEECIKNEVSKSGETTPFNTGTPRKTQEPDKKGY